MYSQRGLSRPRLNMAFLKHSCGLTFRFAPLFGITVLLCLIFSADANAQRQTRSFLNGKLLIQKCNEPDKKFCDGYFAGIVDVIFAGQAINNFRPCIPEGATVEELRKITLRFLSNNPTYLQFAAPGLIAGALAVRYPCP